MKPISWIFSALTVALLLFGSGCGKKSSQAKTLEAGQAEMRTALASASPTVQSNLYNRVEMGIRYGNYDAALAALNDISNDPGLDAKQKKTVSEVAELLKGKLQSPVNP